MNKIIILIGVLAYIFVLIFSLTQFGWVITAGLAILPLLAITVSSGVLFLLVPIATLHSGLQVPGLPGNFQLYMLLSFIYVLFYVFSFAITKKNRDKKIVHLEDSCAKFLIGWILLLIAIRGSGMRVFGSTEIGGAVYFQAIFALCYFVYTRYEFADIRRIRLAGLFLGTLCLLPMTANGLYELSGGVIWQQMLFFRSGAALGETAQAVLEGRATRLAFLSSGTALIWVGIFGEKIGTSIKFGRYFWWSLGGISALMAGFRSAVLSTFTFFLLYGFSKTRDRFRYTITLGFLLFTLYVVLLIFSRDLPFPIQRVIASLPGVEVEWLAKAQGLGTMAWRKGVWDLAMNDIEKYWYFGRGVTFNPEAIPRMALYANDPMVAYLTGSFHQATLELLVLYGAPALVASILLYTGFLARGVRQHFVKEWKSPELKEWGFCILLYVFVRVLVSFSGGVSMELLVTLPIWLAFYNIIKNTDDSMEAVE